MDIAKCSGLTGLERLPICPQRTNCLRYLAPDIEPQQYAAPDCRFTADYELDCRSYLPRDPGAALVIEQPDE